MKTYQAFYLDPRKKTNEQSEYFLYDAKMREKYILKLQPESEIFEVVYTTAQPQPGSTMDINPDKLLPLMLEHARELNEKEVYALDKQRRRAIASFPQIKDIVARTQNLEQGLINDLALLDIPEDVEEQLRKVSELSIRAVFPKTFEQLQGLKESRPLTYDFFFAYASQQASDYLGEL